MSNPPEVPTDWDMWDDIEPKLDAQPVRGPIPLWLWLPALLGLTFYIGTRISLTNSSPNIVDTTTLDNIQIDTIYQTNTIYQTDTITKIEYVTKWRNQEGSFGSDNLFVKIGENNTETFEEYTSFNKNISSEFGLIETHITQQEFNQLQDLAQSNLGLSKFFKTHFTLQSSLNNLKVKFDHYEEAIVNSPFKNYKGFKQLDIPNELWRSNVPSEGGPSQLDSDIAEADLIRKQLEHLFVSPLIPGPIDYTRKLKFKNHYAQVNIPLKKKNLLKQLIPDYINVGASIEAPTIVFVENNGPIFDSGFGLNAELLFSPKMSLETGFRTRKIRFETKDEAIASRYPQPSGVSSEDNFKEVYLTAKYADIPLVVKYHLNQSTIQTYLSGGFLFRRFSKYEFLFEYENNGNEIYRESKGNIAGWNLGYFVFGVGFEMTPFQRTSIFIEPNFRYNFHLPTGQFDKIHGMGLRLGVYYEL